MTPEQEAALALCRDYQKGALLQVLQEFDEVIFDKVEAALADPLLAVSTIGGVLRSARTLYLTTTREALKAALAEHGVAVEGPVVMPGGALAVPPRELTHREMLDLLTDDEQDRILAARKTTAWIDRGLYRFELATSISLTHPDTIGLITAFDFAGLLDHDGRAEEILGGLA